MNSTYEKILDAAYRLFALHGFEKTSLNMIASEVKISKPALYYYFTSKEKLFTVLLDHVMEEIDFEKNTDFTEYTRDNFKDKLINLGNEEIEFHRLDKYFSLLMKEFILYSLRNDQTKNKLYELVESYTNGFRKLLAHGVKIAVLSTDSDIDAKAQMLTMTLDVIGDYIGYGFDYNYKKIWESAVESLAITQKI